MEAPPEEPVDERRMPFTEHLAELRLRLRNSVLAVLLGTIVGYLLKEPLFALTARPLAVAWREAQAQGGAKLPPLEIVYTSLIDGFMVLLKVSLMAGVFIATPVIFHQLWQFVAPGLYDREKRLALPFIVGAVVLFFLGGAFAYLFVLPAGYKYFLGYSTNSMGVVTEILGRHVDVQVTDAFTLRPMVTMDEYFSLTTSLLLIFGAVFELPLVLAVLAMIGIVSPGGLWRFNRYAILIFFVLGAVLTPGDLVVGQVAMAGSLTVLYNLSILITLLVQRRRAAAAAAPEKG